MRLRQLPESLRRCTVEQDYSRYDAADQATWRFVMLHLYEHLRQHAHPSYVAGLQATGLSIERIPRISEIDAALTKLGWRAVAISGFITPRAFQAFQAAGVLPVAAEVRSPEHLAYTPAPDIIHEAAGHAPILVNQEYGEYLRSVGSVGQLAFSSPADVAVNAAIANLSAIKEQHAASHQEIARAQKQLADAVCASHQSSEATRMARLYWWTAEYGLIGTPRDYRLYGAGLLSSLGEAHHCRRDAVVKIPLSLAALDVDYDITQPQPQLFVARDFTHLMDVLAEARRELAAAGPLPVALRAAVKSGLPARVDLGLGRAILGRLIAFDGVGERVEHIEFSGACQFVQSEAVRQVGAFSQEAATDVTLPVGALESLRLAGHRHSPEAAARLFERLAAGGELSAKEPALRAPVSLRFTSGIEVEGTLTGLATHAAKSDVGADKAEGVRGASPLRASLQLQSAVVRSAVFTRRYERLLLPLGVVIGGVRPADDMAVAIEESPGKQAPSRGAPALPSTAKPCSSLISAGLRLAPDIKCLNAKQSALRDLYERAAAIWSERAGEAAVPLLEAIGDELGQFPEDWLLRWNLLECLLKLGAFDRTANLVRELETLELRHKKQQPIATGLRSLRLRAQASMNVSTPSHVTGKPTS